MATLNEKSLRAMSYIDGVLQAIEQYGDKGTRELASRMRTALTDIYEFEGYDFVSYKNKDMCEFNTVKIFRKNNNTILYTCSDETLEKIVALLDETKPTAKAVSGEKRKKKAESRGEEV